MQYSYNCNVLVSRNYQCDVHIWHRCSSKPTQWRSENVSFPTLIARRTHILRNDGDRIYWNISAMALILLFWFFGAVLIWKTNFKSKQEMKKFLFWWTFIAQIYILFCHRSSKRHETLIIQIANSVFASLRSWLPISNKRRIGQRGEALFRGRRLVFLLELFDAMLIPRQGSDAYSSKYGKQVPRKLGTIILMFLYILTR